MFGYLENLRFHGIPKDSADVKFAKASSAELGLPLLVLGRRALDYMNFVDHRFGIQTQLTRSVGLEIDSLHSPRFRQHVLSLPQLPVPSKPYAFMNLKSSMATIEFPKHLGKTALAERILEDPQSPIYSHGRLLLEASQHWSIGSAFMCLSLVMGSSPSKKFYFGNVPLGQDDPQGDWAYVPLVT
jgi:hypothetical protein